MRSSDKSLEKSYKFVTGDITETTARTHTRTHARTDGRLENITPPAPPKAVITIATRLRYDYDTTMPRRIRLRRK